MANLELSLVTTFSVICFLQNIGEISGSYYYYNYPRNTTYWPYEYKIYCWPTFDECHHPASTPFPDVNWKQLNTKYKNKWQSGPWWEYPCFYYSEEALLSLSANDSATLQFKCSDDKRRGMFLWHNRTWLQRRPQSNWPGGEDDYYEFNQIPTQPSQMKSFFERNNFTG